MLQDSCRTRSEFSDNDKYPEKGPLKKTTALVFASCEDRQALA